MKRLLILVLLASAQTAMACPYEAVVKALNSKSADERSRASQILMAVQYSQSHPSTSSNSSR